MLHFPLNVVPEILGQVDVEEVVAGVVRFAHGGNWASLFITLLFGALLVMGGTAGVRKLLGTRIPWLRTKRGGILIAAFWGFLEASALAVLAGVPPKVAFTLGLNAALTGSGARDWWRKSKQRATFTAAPNEDGDDTMTRENTPPESTPTEPINPLPTAPTEPPAPVHLVPTLPTPQSIGDGSTDVAPHCTPEQIADGKCDR